MEQKVILVNLPPSTNYNYRSAGSIYPATGILVIGTILKRQGLAVQIIDGTVKSNYIERTLDSIEDDTVMIGFSVMTSQVPLAFDLSRLIKTEHPDIQIVWGGIHPILFPEQTLRNPNIDIVVTGEGYHATLSLIDYLNGKIGLRQVRGVGFKDDSGNVVLNEPGEPDDIGTLPHIDYSILEDIELYLSSKSVYQRELAGKNNERLDVMPVLTGLGCCYKCQFCINVILKRSYRYRPAASIIEEIKKLQKNYGANTFILYDEDFFINKKRLFEFLDLVERENLKFFWRAWARVDYFNNKYIDRDLILRLEKCGLRSIVMGGESGSQKVLDIIKKGIKVNNILHSVKMLDGTMITPRYSFIIGLEGEEKDDTEKTYKLCADLIDANRKVDIAGPFIFRYYPGSPIFDNIIKNYNIEVPQKVEDWKSYLSGEGYLKIDEMPWVWHGCIETATILNKAMLVYAKLRNVDNLMSKLMKRIIMWRIRNLFIKLPVELFAFDLLKWTYRKRLKMFSNN
jgi:radical SAM superfamily enzyme YgiQ (UPF0313 family)